MRDAHKVILRPIMTERSMWLRDAENQYTFEVALDANKIEIRQALAALFPKVKVLSVNTVRRKGKMRRVRTAIGRTKETKRAIVTVAEGQTIDLT
ncbi:MAG: 50S ribosomal protein L23 [Candidatus Sumerlaeia bacterium]|nr:50S ribosomal protein L23 [Candidatus Sumerlaeia bacterium]